MTELAIEWDSITLAEGRAIKEKLGVSPLQSWAEGKLDEEMLGALAWVVARRSDPTVSFEEILSRITYAQLGELLAAVPKGKTTSVSRNGG